MIEPFELGWPHQCPRCGSQRLDTRKTTAVGANQYERLCLACGDMQEGEEMAWRCGEPRAARNTRTDGPKTEVRVRYGEGGARFDLAARSLRSVRLLEIVAERTADAIVLRAPLTFEARSCGAPHAHWDAVTRTVTICYELAEDFARLYADFDAEPIVSRR
jgi:hypothetical protein